MTALEDLTALLANLPNASLITDKMKQDALAGALIPDSFNVWPGQPGYEATSDPYFAAIGLIGFLQAQPVVRQSSSEGTSVAVDAPNWAGLTLYYQSMSRVSQATSNDVLGVVVIPGGSHVRRTDMKHGGGSYDDVDTDLG